MLLTAIAATAAAFAQPSRRPLPDADPALWVVRDSDTTIYLFGTFHTLDGTSDWFNDEIHEAFAQSDELILETLLPKLDRRPRMQRQASRPGTQAVTQSASFIAATRMAVTAGRDRGLDIRKGADMILRNAAEDTGKTVGGLETVAYQLQMLGRMAAPGGPSVQPMQARATRANMGELMSQMQASWSRGDQRIFTSLLERMRQASPSNYGRMFPQRNAHWADWVVKRMERPGTVFVAVGAGHFAGPDSVLANLSSRGATPARVN